jgi:hypothetical protein
MRIIITAALLGATLVSGVGNMGVDAPVFSERRDPEAARISALYNIAGESLDIHGTDYSYAAVVAVWGVEVADRNAAERAAFLAVERAAERLGDGPCGYFGPGAGH